MNCRLFSVDISTETGPEKILAFVVLPDPAAKGLWQDPRQWHRRQSLVVRVDKPGGS